MTTVPVGWERTTIADLCSFGSGTGFGPSSWSTAGWPIIRIQNLNGSTDFNFFAGEPDPDWIVEPGELLFAWAGVKGVSFGPTIWRGPRGVLNQHIYRIRAASDIHLEWLYLQLLHVTALIEAQAHGFKSSLVHVRKSDITTQICYRPSFAEQKAIAAIVSTWDRGIRQLTELITAKVSFKQGLMQQLLTGRLRFGQFISSAELQTSPAGRFPKDWTLSRLGDVTEEVRRKNDSGATRVLTASGTHGLVDQRDFFNRSVAGKSLEGYYLLKRGEFAYNRSLMKGYPHGATKRLDLYDEGVVSTLYLCFRIASKDIDSNWLTHVFESDVFNSQLRGIAKMGARAHGLLNVAASEFFHMILPMPCKEEQAEIAAVLDNSEKEIDLLQRQLEILKKQKKGLIQKLLTGDTRIRQSRASHNQ